MRGHFGEAFALFADALAAMLNAGQIAVMNVLYRVIAVQLTDLENHRTQPEYSSDYYRCIGLKVVSVYVASPSYYQIIHSKGLLQSKDFMCHPKGPPPAIGLLTRHSKT